MDARGLFGRVDALARPFLIDFAALVLAALAFVSLEGRIPLVRQPAVFPWVAGALTAFALLYALCVRAGEALVDRGAFREPTGVLWFLPLAHLVAAFAFWSLALHLPMRYAGELWWCEATGLDFTRFQQLVRLLTALLGLNCALAIGPAVGHYFRSFAIARAARLLPGSGGRPFIGSSRPVMRALLAILALLLFYVARVSPDHLEWWRIRFAWRMHRDPVEAVRSAAEFLERHPASRFRENALFFLGSRRHPLFDGGDATGGDRLDAALQAYLSEYPGRPYAPEATLLLAGRLARRGQTAEALLLAERFAAEHPRQPLADDLLALAYRIERDAGRRAEAAALRRRLEADYPDAVVFRCGDDEELRSTVPTLATLEDPMP